MLNECLSDTKKVYVKGDLKKQWLERFNLPVQDVASIDYTQQPIKVVNFCLNHKPQRKIKCALHNVKIMKKIILENSEWETMDWEEIV